MGLLGKKRKSYVSALLPLIWDTWILNVEAQVVKKFTSSNLIQNMEGMDGTWMGDMFLSFVTGEGWQSGFIMIQKVLGSNTIRCFHSLPFLTYPIGTA